ALPDHQRRRLHRHHGTVGRLVGAGAGADVEHALGGAERVEDGGGDARVGATMGPVVAADLVVELTHRARGSRYGRGAAMSDVQCGQRRAFAGIAVAQCGHSRVGGAGGGGPLRRLTWRTTRKTAKAMITRLMTVFRK